MAGWTLSRSVTRIWSTVIACDGAALHILAGMLTA
jgi:hypothetical protein